jgi:hypothetical protein
MAPNTHYTSNEHENELKQDANTENQKGKSKSKSLTEKWTKPSKTF